MGRAESLSAECVGLYPDGTLRIHQTVNVKFIVYLAHGFNNESPKTWSAMNNVSYTCNIL